MNTMHTHFFLLFTLALGVANSGLAQTSVQFQSGQDIAARQWDVVDVKFAGPAGITAPIDAEVAANFAGPGGERLKVPLFYNGGTEFVLRFTPPTAGQWKFRTASAVAGLDGLSGIINAAAPAAGPIGIAATSKQRFAYADGTSYFPIAFECDWLFALDAKNRGGIPRTRTLVNTIAENGFNQVVMNVYAYDVAWPADPKLKPEFNYARPDYSPYGGSNEKPDYSTLNVEFFQHFDRVMAALDDKNVAAHLMIYVWNKKVNWPKSRSAEDNRYFDYVVKRYQAYPNLIWDISKEATGYGHNDMDYITDRIDRLRGLDAFRRLMTVHDYGYCAKFPEKVDFVSIQTWTTDLWSAMNVVREKHPMKPIFNIEHGGYEEGPFLVFTGDFLSAETCLERAYQCVFAGASLTHYWQDTSWTVVIHDIAALPAAQRPKLEYYKHLAAFVGQPWFGTLAPSARKHSSSGFCLTDGKTRFAYYVPKENSAIQLWLKDKIGQRVLASWFNPLTGETRQVKPMVAQQFLTVLPQPDWKHFSILNVEVLP
jgi:Protein of unknown function (DUF4038)/Domain of unknown function (DUF5060)